MRCLLPLFVGAALPCIAGTIMSGSATYTTGALPTSQTGNGPAADFRPLGGATTDHLVRNWWYYRVSGDTRERPFGNYTKSGGGTVSTTEVSSGNQSTFTIRETAPSSAERFTAVLAYTLSSGPSGSWTLLEMSLAVRNPTAVPLTIAFFNYIDANVQGTSNNDAAILFAPNKIRITDPSGYFLFHSAVTTPAAYQVTAANTLRSSLLNASVTNLANTGLPFGSGNYTGAWQWNMTLNPGQTQTIYSIFSDVDPAELPEPSSLALAGIGVAAILLARVRTSLSTKPAASARHPGPDDAPEAKP